jgi:ACS family hexuronate transporter-like MFS transporter
VAFISIATSCHQAWSANMFTVASDAFPSRAVGSVVGFGGMCGGIGGMLMLLVAGGMLQWLGSFTALFILAGVMHPLAWIAIRALTGRTIETIDLDRGLRTERSPVLLALGSGLAVVGAAVAFLVFRHWEYILSVTKNSVAAAAGGAAAASLLAIMGLALIHASREVRIESTS